jgi:phosphoglycerate dehydrogenase-like enzyme
MKWTMSSKPVVALALAADWMAQMFFPEDLQRLREAVDVRDPARRADARTLSPLLGDATIAITGWGTPRFDVDLLAHAPYLRLIAHSGGSVRGLVTPAVYERGIRITTAAAGNAVPVAEFTVAMMVAMLKQIPWIIEPYTRGDAKAVGRRVASIRELRDLSIGLVGASRVGREVIRLLCGYPRLTVKLYDPHLSSAGAQALGVEHVSLEEVCRCDVVSIHAPDLPETRHMINARTLALLPDHAVLINTARGALIDESALVLEVRKRPLYVLLDVTDPEPPEKNSPLRREANILLTPHLAGAMKEARRDMGRIAIEETLRFVRGEPLQHEVTREMLPTQA